jgi:hypothetical protein
LSEDAQGGAVLWFGGPEGPQPRVEILGVKGDAFKLEAQRKKHRGSVETLCFPEGAVLRAKLPGDRAFTLFVEGPVPPGTAIQVGGNEIRF